MGITEMLIDGNNGKAASVSKIIESIKVKESPSEVDSTANVQHSEENMDAEA